MRKLAGIVIVLAVALTSLEAAAQCTVAQAPANSNAYNAGLYDYYCSVYGGTYCDQARQYAALANVPIFSTQGTQCKNAALYNYYCRYYEYNNTYFDSCTGETTYYGWNYANYCTQAQTQATTNSCCPAPPGPPVSPELEPVHITYNSSTGDYAYDWCATKTGYSTAAKVNVYRLKAGQAAGTTYPARQIYQCYRWVTAYNPDGVYHLKKDDYASTDPGCRGGYNVGNIGALLTTASEGSKNYPLYLCQMTANVQSGGGTWSELRVYTSCSGGTTLETLGYARYDNPSQNPNHGDVAANGTCDAAHCMGECGLNCDGILGAHYNTDACQAHDDCVCRNGGNAWAIECVGQFALAAVSFVVAAAFELLQTVLNFLLSVGKAVLDFLCFWC